MTNKKLIAKNTVFLYTRMIFIMGVTLYTSRVVLDKLGVQDFGLYNVVGGIVGMLSFLNGTLSTGTSRFITYELGTGDKDSLLQTFRTSVLAHFILGIIVILLLETIGLWYVYNKMVIPQVRFDSTVIVYHISILAAFISIIEIPFIALIIAHEDMKPYAYIGIIEAMAKLITAVSLIFCSTDKLVFYAILTALSQLIIFLCYSIYCIRTYSECKFGFSFNKEIFKAILSFSGWNVLANLSETLKLQGYLVILNLFFQPFVVAAQTIANQVSGVVNQFINNFRNAVNPQIIKLYASHQYEESKSLTMQTTIMVFELSLLIGLPAILIMNTLMSIWLVKVPGYAVVFTQFVIVQRILGSFDSAFYTPMMAAAKIKTNSICAAISGPVLFIALYFIFKFNGNVMWMQYLGILAQCIFGFAIKPILLKQDVEGYQYSDFKKCFATCFKVTFLAIIISTIAYFVIGNKGILPSIGLAIVSALSVMFSSYVFLDKASRQKIISIVKDKIKK